MLDIFPFLLPPRVALYVAKLSEYTGLYSLQNHLHEVVIAAALYHFLFTTASPYISTLLFNSKYTRLDKRTKVNWDIHAVALVQSVIISALALYVANADQERYGMSWQERVYGYTGALGLLQALAAGYFVWDLYVCIKYFDLFGFGLLAHAICALYVFMTGFRPLFNWYAAPYLLYELSSPFLNIHWFCDKLGLTGSKLQRINGTILLIAFFGARIVYGTYVSTILWADVYRVFELDKSSPLESPLAFLPRSPNNDMTKFARDTPFIPRWILAGTLISNIVLYVLNLIWFNKMLSAIRKRFDPPFGTKGRSTTQKSLRMLKVNKGASSGRQIVEIKGVEMKHRGISNREEEEEEENLVPPQ